MAKLRQPTLPLINYQALCSVLVFIVLAAHYIISNYHIEYHGAAEADDCRDGIMGLGMKMLPFQWGLMMLWIALVELYLKKQDWIPRHFLNGFLLAFGFWAQFNLTDLVTKKFFPEPACAIGRRELDFDIGQNINGPANIIWLLSLTMIFDGLPGTPQTLYDCLAICCFPSIEENGRPKYVKSVKEYFLNILFHWGIMFPLFGLCLPLMSVLVGLHPLLFHGVFAFYAFVTVLGVVFAIIIEGFFRFQGCVGCLLGVVPAHTMWMPILSTSVKEFWGQRYNIWIHHYLKNFCYKPIMSFLAPKTEKNVSDAKEKKSFFKSRAPQILALTATMWMGAYLHEVGSYQSIKGEDKEQYFKEATFQTIPTGGVFGPWFLFYGFQVVAMLVEDYFKGLNIPDFFKHQMFMLFFLPSIFLALYVPKFNYLDLFHEQLPESMKAAPYVITFTRKAALM